MKILHTIETSGPGGAENFLIRTVLALKPRYQSLILLIKPGWLQQRLKELGFEVEVEELHRTLDPRWLWRVGKLIKSQDIDIIHSHEFAMNLHMSILASFLKVRHVATVHGKEYWGETGARRLACRFVAKMSKFVAVSEDIKSHLVEELGIPEERVFVIPNAIDVSEYTNECLDIEHLRAELGCDSDGFLICAIGNLYEVKGHKYLLEAMSGVISKYPKVRLVIAGRGDQHGRLKKQIEDMGLQGKIKLLGFRDDVTQILAASDLFVMPSLSEGLPLSLLEAMASKLPVIVTSVGGMPQIVVSGETGILVPPRDETAIQKAIFNVLEDEGYTKAMIDAAYTKLVSEYSIENMLLSYEELYLSAM